MKVKKLRKRIKYEDVICLDMKNPAGVKFLHLSKDDKIYPVHGFDGYTEHMLLHDNLLYPLRHLRDEEWADNSKPIRLIRKQEIIEIKEVFDTGSQS